MVIVRLTFGPWELAVSYNNLRVHFVWSTRGRRKLIRDEIQADLYAYIGGILRKRDHVLLAAGGVADHLHLLVAMHQSQPVADCVRDVKSNSCAWIHDQCSRLRSFQWQTKYGAFSVSHSSVASVVEYISNQAEHHQVVSYQDEFLMFLRKSGIDFDPRYVFE